MRNPRPLWVIIALFATSSLLISAVPAQQVDAIDPFQFDALANSKAFRRWHWAFQQRAYPLMDIPDGAHARASEEAERLREIRRLDSVTLQNEQWTSIGPGPIIAGSTPWSGRVPDVAVDPGNPNHWLIGAAQGGIWETRDAGTTWTPVTDSQPSLAMGAIAFAPGNPNIVYAGTGEASFSADSFYGGGLLKSSNGGSTWQLIHAETFAKTTFSEVKVDPANAGVLVAATSRGTSGRGGGTPILPPSTGILRSTNGGINWSNPLSGRGTDIEVHPGDFNSQYAAIGEIFTNAANGIYRSSNAGETWSRVSTPFDGNAAGLGRIELAIAPSNPNILYVSVQDGFNSNGNDGALLGVWRTDNAWAQSPSWMQLPQDPGFNGERQWWYDHEITVHPSDQNVVFIGGVNLRRFDGATWSFVTNGIHADQQSFAWAGDRLIVGNDGGVWSTTDAGATWNTHNTNLVITQFYDGALHPTNANFALGGSQDNGTERWDGGQSWRAVFGGDGSDSAVSLTRPDEHWIVSFQNLGLRRTLNGGNSFTIADVGIDKASAPFIARIEKNPLNDDIVLVGTDNLWRTTDFFSGPIPSWSSNGPDMRSPQGLPVGISAIAFAVSDLTGRTYAFATGAGHLMLTTDAGISWRDIDPGAAVPDRFVTDLIFDPANANELYLTLSGYNEGLNGQPGHVFKTSTALSGSPTWSDMSPSVNIPHNTIVLDQFTPGVIYVGTDLGVFRSTDDGGNWHQFGNGLPNVSVFDLQLSHATGRLVAFTHGRGAWATSVTLVDPPPILTSATLSLQGEVVSSAEAGQNGLRVTVTGNGFRSDTEISVNGTPVVTQLTADPRQRIIDLDQNLAIRNSAGPVIVRARNVNPLSEGSNVATAGVLLGPEISRIKVRPKGFGILLKVRGDGFQESSTVRVLDPAGSEVSVQSVIFIARDFLKVKLSGLAAGTALRVRVISPNGVNSNEVTVVTP